MRAGLVVEGLQQLLLYEMDCFPGFDSVERKEMASNHSKALCLTFYMHRATRMQRPPDNANHHTSETSATTQSPPLKPAHFNVR